MALRLHSIIVSTRPGRVGPAVGKWFHERAEKHGKFDARLVDLAEFNLPVFDEARHPRLRQYEKEHTKAWSASVEAADAFVFILPEYNYSPPPSLLNALDFLFLEWQCKPVGLVSYGGQAAGLRSAQAAKLPITALKMMPLPEGVAIPFVAQQIEAGVFKANEGQEKSAGILLDELHRWAEALKPLRAKA